MQKQECAQSEMLTTRKEWKGSVISDQNTFEFRKAAVYVSQLNNALTPCYDVIHCRNPLRRRSDQ